MANTSIDPFLPVVTATRETADSTCSSDRGTDRFDDHIRRAIEPPDSRDGPRQKLASTNRTKTDDSDGPRGDSKGSSTDDPHVREEAREAMTADAADPPSEIEEKDQAEDGDTVVISSDTQPREQAAAPNQALLKMTNATDPLAAGQAVAGEQEATGGEASNDDGTDLPPAADGQPQTAQPTAPPIAESAPPEDALPGQADPTGQSDPLTKVTAARTDGAPTAERSSDGNPTNLKSSTEYQAATAPAEELSPPDLAASATETDATQGDQNRLAENDGAEQVAPQSALAQTSSTAPSAGDSGDRTDHRAAREHAARLKDDSAANQKSPSNQPSAADGQMPEPISQVATVGIAAAAAIPEDPSLPSQVESLSTQSKGAIDRLSVGRSVQPSGLLEEDAKTGPVDRARFVQRVGGALRLAHQRDGQMQLRLSPPDLGSLKIELSVKQGVLTATLETETAAARNALLDNLPALRERLAEQDIRIEQFDVDVRRDGQQGSENRAMQERRHGPGQDRSASARAKEPDPSDHPNSGVPVHHSHATDRVLNGLDVVV
jgi:flagellar hook-length control protein FliK